MATTIATSPADKPASSGKLKRFALLVLVALGAAGAAAAGTYAFLTHHGLRLPAAASKPVALPVPVFFTLEPLTVNLQSDDGLRYLRVGLSLKLTDPSAQAYLTEHMPEIRSRILLALSNKRPDELATVDGKRALAEELKQLVEQPTQPGNRSVRIDAVLFTDFVVQ